MNLEDLICVHGLQQDAWSLTAPLFGSEGQLEVVGWGGERPKGYNKFYILKCRICCMDSELFGEGYFKSIKSGLTDGQIPCGCGRTKWSQEQYIVLCSRKAREVGHTFLGFAGEWKGYATKIKMSCEVHGEWSTGSINALLNADQGCPMCGIITTASLKIKPDEVMRTSFISSGGFHPDTKFWRSDRVNAQGCKVYWFMSCPDCGETGEAVSPSLQQGQRPCACSKHRQQEGYINLVMDGVDTVAIKFGIANSSKSRVKSQNRQSAYEIRKHRVYRFPSVTSCKKAEKDCKQEFDCGVVLRRDMPDGYTETTWLYNLERVIEIYERNGGVKVDEPTI